MGHRVIRVLKVNLRVSDLDAALRLYGEAFGAELLVHRGDDTIGDFQAASMQLPGLTLDFVSPNSPQSPLAAQIAKRGEGLDSFAIEVENLDDTLAHLERLGLQIASRIDHGENRLAFVHPRGTHGVSIEVIEARD